ncbi:tetratricopeptide repeat protein [Actinoplanes sp. CA-015351]|uniref:tetratricopeptide repeat protein n=1 Tax=Actinoplanes sp. CA-015351 TaxID=3239897 RepID=UPI003D976680
MTVLTAVLGLFTGIVTNLLSDQIPPDIARFARPLFAACLLGTIVLTVLTVRGNRGDGGNRFRPVKVRTHTDPIALGVHPAEQIGTSRSPAYVERDIDRELGLMLKRHGFVLVVGESAAGKTRAAYEAMRQHLPRHLLLVPSAAAPLTDLLDVFARTRRSVLWLDDLERYLGTNGLTAALLTTMRLDGRSQRRIVATMRTEELGRFAARRQKAADTESRIDLRDGRTLIDQAASVKVDRLWSDRELSRAAALAADPRIAHALPYGNQFGLAEVLADGPDLLRDWIDGWAPGTHPRAAALVAAAVDCRRVGMFSPVSRDILVRLHERHLAERGGALLRPEPLDEAFAWACETLRGQTSLLIGTPDRGYLVFDYLVDRLQQTEHLQDIDEDVWQTAATATDATEAYSVGVAAQNGGRLALAATSLRRAFDNSNPEAGVRLADCLGELGRVHEAVAAAREAVTAAEQNWGTLHPDTVSAKRTLAHWLNGSGRLREAIQVCEELLHYSVASLGESHVETIGVRYQLGLTTGLLGDPRSAVRLLTGVVEARERILGPDHPDTFLARSLAAWWISESGRPAEALELYHRLEADRTRVFGPADARTLHTRARVAALTGLAGDPAGALALYRRLLVDRTNALGAGHQHTLHTRSRVALWTLLNGDAVEAVRLFRAVVVDRTQSLGADHPATLISRLLLARSVGESGEPAEAVAMCQVLVTDSDRVLGDHHPDTFAARAEWARWTGEAGRGPTAVAMLTALVRDYTELLGADHPQTLIMRNNAACWRDSTGRPEEAVAVLRDLHTDYVATLGPDHPDALLVRHNIAYCVANTGDKASAIIEYSALIADLTRVLGPHHPDTLAASSDLGSLTGSAPRHPGALSLLGTNTPSHLSTTQPARPAPHPPRAVIEGLGFEPFDLRIRKRL